MRAGVYLSYLNLALGMIIPFFYTPLMLKTLGQAEYGLYSLAGSAVSYLSLLSFGFGSTILRYISKYRAEENREAEQVIVGFFLLLYCFLGILVLIGGGIISINVEPIFHRGLNGYELNKMRILVWLMTLNSALSFPLSVYSSVITAHEKYIFRKLVDMISTVAAPIFNLIALWLGFASVGMCVAATMLQLLMLPINIVYCYKWLKIRPLFRSIPRHLIKEMLGFSFYIFLGTIVDMLFWATDKVILGMLSGSVAVAIYNVGGTFNNIVMNLSTSISGVLTPRVTGMVVKDAPQSRLNELFIRVGRLQFIIIALIVTGFTVFGQTFIKLWAGSDYLEAYWVAILTMFPLCIPLIENTGLTIIVAKNKHKFRSIVYLVIAIANVISTYMIVPTRGFIGAALCSCISYIIGQGVIMNFYYYKVIGIDIPLFGKNILKMGIIPGLMLISCFRLKISELINNWIMFFTCVFVYTVLYFILMYVFTFNEYEKNVIKNPFMKVIRKFR